MHCERSRGCWSCSKLPRTAAMSSFSCEFDTSSEVARRRDDEDDEDDEEEEPPLVTLRVV